MLNITLNFENKKTLMDSINRLATAIAYEAILKVNTKSYLITDFEFYINSFTAETKDPHTYNHNLQKEYGKIYDHKSGLDITFGNGENAVGVLIRGIVELYKKPKHNDPKASELFDAFYIKNHFASPHKARTEIISNLQWGDNKLSFDKVSSITEAYPRPNFQLLRTTRINLTAKADDPNHLYMQAPLRFVSLIPRYKRTEDGKYIPNGNPMRIPTIEKLLKLALSDDEIPFTDEQVLEFIDYKLSQK